MINLSDYKKSIKVLLDDPDSSEFDAETVSLMKRGKAYRAKRQAKIVKPSSDGNATLRRIG